MQADAHLFIAVAQPLAPHGQVIDFPDAPFRMGPFAFAVAPQVDEQDIIAQAAIDFHIRQAHGPILVEAVDEDDRLMGIMTVLDIRPAQDRPVLTIDPDRFPAPFLFPLADGGHVSAVVLDAQELVPGSIIKFFISHVSDISPDTAQDDGQADQEQEQAFQESLHHDTLQLPVPAGFYFILHGSQRRTASCFNGGDDGTFRRRGSPGAVSAGRPGFQRPFLPS